MLDYNLAELYQVETRTLNQAVKRNIERFPEDFMFTTSWGGSRKLPFAFTEEGLAMLSKQEEPRRKIGFKTGADS